MKINVPLPYQTMKFIHMEEVFLEIKNHPGYFISNFGRVRKGNNHIMAVFTRQKGYVIVVIMEGGVKSHYMVHRLVAEAFIGSLDGKEVNHKNFDKGDNRVDNLEIVTRAENMRHYHSNERAKEVYKRISATKIAENCAKRKRDRFKGRILKLRSKRKSNKIEKENRGGARQGSGQPMREPSEGPRITQPLNLSPSNFAFLSAMGRGKHDYINALLLKERGLKNTAE